MKKHVRFIVPLVGLALVTIFAASSKVSDYRKLGGNLLAAIGLQNATSSQGTASSTSGDVPDSTSTPTLADALQQFQDQVRSLNAQMTDLRSKIEITNLRSIFTRTLKRGDTGDDVSKLQEFLTRFPELYSSDADVSSAVTGFYGSLTKAAVMQFQSQAGLQETGIFDISTREKFYESLNALAQDSASTEFTPIDISSIITDLNNSDGSRNQSSNDIQADIMNLQDQVSQLAQDSTSTKANVADLQNQVAQLSSDLAKANEEIANLQNQPSASPSAPPPTPATSIPLAISNVQVANITKTSSTIMWITNALSSSEVHYSTYVNLPTNKTVIVSSAVMATNHAAALQNLNSGTKYYYLVLSKDSTNVTASSTIQNFTTLH